MCVDDETFDDEPSYFAGCLAALTLIGVCAALIGGAILLGLSG